VAAVLALIAVEAAGQAAEETLVLVTALQEQRELRTLEAEPVAVVMAHQVKPVDQALLFYDTLTEHL
tara:strand:- start:508 stop:708 length:201 start_codon:yes stop_codon:yes gene_type:complete